MGDYSVIKIADTALWRNKFTKRVDDSSDLQTNCICSYLLATPHRAALTGQLWTNEECQRHYSWAQSEKRQTKHTEAKSRYNKLSACSQKRSDVRTPLQYILRHICAPAPWIMFLLWKETGQPWIPCSIRLLRSPLTHLIKNVEWVCIQRCWFVFSF